MTKQFKLHQMTGIKELIICLSYNKVHVLIVCELTRSVLCECSYVLASQAYFLWDAEDEVDDEDGSKNTPSFFHGAPSALPPLAAAS